MEEEKKDYIHNHHATKKLKIFEYKKRRKNLVVKHLLCDIICSAYINRYMCFEEEEKDNTCFQCVKTIKTNI